MPTVPLHTDNFSFVLCYIRNNIIMCVYKPMAGSGTTMIMRPDFIIKYVSVDGADVDVGVAADDAASALGCILDGALDDAPVPASDTAFTVEPAIASPRKRPRRQPR